MKKVTQEALQNRYTTRLGFIASRIAEDDPFDYTHIMEQLDKALDEESFQLTNVRSAYVTGYWQALVDIMIRKGAY